jgi:hypothetical protein
MSTGGVENTEYAAFVARAIRAAGRRVADGDPEDLAELTQLKEQLDEAMAVAVRGLRAAPHSHSWSRIAACLGITRQAAMQRWPEAGGTRKPGGQPSAIR